MIMRLPAAATNANGDANDDATNDDDIDGDGYKSESENLDEQEIQNKN